jgi:hypothetical protein
MIIGMISCRPRKYPNFGQFSRGFASPSRLNFVRASSRGLLHFRHQTLSIESTRTKQTFTMAPTRRYLRITKYSVLECRIYMEDPTLTDSWLLRKNDPALPRIIAAVRPSVLPKLREENERTKTKSKGKKKGAIKDLITQGDQYA